MNNIKIGLECHIQLNTKSKLFCGCPNTISEIPNSLTCETCLGMPGSKPVLNKAAIEKALKTALAINCKINHRMFFSRKSYFYPDLPKNFQITQYEVPLAEKGSIYGIKIRKIHLEEDPGKIIHKKEYCLLDYNRSGIPLVEVVTEPDFKDPKKVRIFLQKLTTLLEYLNVYFRSSESTLRTDVNISMNNGERVEIKNISGIKDVEKALNYEIIRQSSLIKSKQRVKRETRSWNPMTKSTILLREKETEEDYGYIFEPDLTEIELERKKINNIKEKLPELEDEKIKRFQKQYNIDNKYAKVLSQDLLLAGLFEKVAKKINSKLAAKWLVRELLRVLNYNKKSMNEIEFNEKHLIELLNLVQNKKITEATAQKIMEKLIEKPFPIKEYVKKNKLDVLDDTISLEKICKKVISENSKVVGDYKTGKKEAFHFLIGIVMQETKNTADPSKVNKILKKLI